MLGRYGKFDDQKRQRKREREREGEQRESLGRLKRVSFRRENEKKEEGKEVVGK